MSLALFQLLCLPVLLLVYALRIRLAANPRHAVKEIAILVVAGLIGEHSMIEAYEFYAYADGWWARVGHVPLLVPLIWPMVILSARDVARALWPDHAGWKRALQVGAIVVFDASVMEVIAVGAGFWTWAEPGYLRVPLLGMIGWGCFGAVATWYLQHARQWRFWLTPVVSIAAAHLMVLALWWALFRWTLRGDLGELAVLGFALFGLVYAHFVFRARDGDGRRRAMPSELVLARVPATAVFVALLVSMGFGSSSYLWIHLAVAALPYLLATRWSELCSFGSAQKDVLGQASQ